MIKLTVKDLFEKKGKQKLIELYVTNSLEAHASEQAGIDILIVSFNKETLNFLKSDHRPLIVDLVFEKN